MAIIGVVENITGTVTVLNSSGERRTLQKGDPLMEGDELITGDDGSLGIALANGKILELGAGSDFAVTANLLNESGSRDEESDALDELAEAIALTESDPFEDLPTPAAGVETPEDTDQSIIEEVSSTPTENVVARESVNIQESITDVLDAIEHSQDDEQADDVQSGRYSTALDATVFIAPEYAPTLTINEKQDVVFEESVKAGDVVAELTANDRNGDTVSFRLTRGNEQGYFTVDASAKVMLTEAGAAAINGDRGIDLTQLTLGVTATDGDLDSDEAIIAVDITRVNDNAPTIDTAMGSQLLEHAITAGDVVAVITASDLDDSSPVFYRISSGNDAGYFTIDEQTGSVRLNQSGVDAINSDEGIDITALTIGVTASDGLNASNEVAVRIDIDRVNDNAPIIDHADAYMLMEEAISTGDIVAIFTASDSDDSDDSNALQYSLSRGDEHGYFTIESSSGVVRLTEAGVVAINQDALSLTELTVGVTATDGQFISEEMLTTIDITRVNDNAPVISDTSAWVTDEDTALLLTKDELLRFANDLDGDDLRIENVSTASGTITNNGNDTWTYTPAENSSGDVTLHYEVSDGELHTATSATITVAPVVDAPNLTINNALNEVSGLEDSEIPLAINAQLTDRDGSETLSITVSDVPEGVTLSAGINHHDGTWSLEPEELNGLTLTPLPDFSGILALTVTATAKENSTGAIVTATEMLNVVVTPVTDGASLNVTNDVYHDLVLDENLIQNNRFDHSGHWHTEGLAGIHGNQKVLAFGGGSADSGGIAEQSFQGHPDIQYSLTLSHKRHGYSHPMSGHVELIDEHSGEVLASKTFETNSPSMKALTLDFTAISTGNITLRITDTTIEGAGSSDLWVDNVSVQASSVTNAILTPGVAGNEDQSIALSVESVLHDTDGSETVSSVAIEDIPAGIVISDGTHSVTSSGTAIDVSGWDLSGLMLTPPENENDDFTAKLSAVVVEQATGETFTTTAFIDVHIAAVADAAVISGENQGEVIENAVLSASGKLMIDDADDRQSAFVPETISTDYGSLSITPEGIWTYQTDDNIDTIQRLSRDDALTDTIAVRSLDGTQHDVTVSIHGTNDAAHITGIDTGNLIEDTGSLLASSGVLSIQDIDAGEAYFQGVCCLINVLERGCARWESHNGSSLTRMPPIVRPSKLALLTSTTSMHLALSSASPSGTCVV